MQNKLEHFQHEEQEPIFSEEAKREKKIHSFKQYLVNSGCVMHLIKFLLGVRNKQKADDSIPNQDALKMFQEYIGTVEIDMTEHNQLKDAIQEAKDEGMKLKKEIEQVKAQIAEKKAQKQKEDEQRRLKQEEQATKNAKKGAKK